MSDYKYYTGTLTDISDGKDPEEVAKTLLKSLEGLEKYPSYYNCWVDALCNIKYKDYVFVYNTLFSVNYDEEDINEDIFISTDKGYGNYEFMVKYHDGGCCFQEAMGEALDNVIG